MRLLFILLFSVPVLTSQAELITQIIHFDYNSAFLSAQERGVLQDLLPLGEQYFIEKIDIDGYCGTSGGEEIAHKRAQSIYGFLTTRFPDKGDYEIRINPQTAADGQSSNCATIRVYYLDLSKGKVLNTSALFPEEFPEDLVDFPMSVEGRLQIGEILFHGNSAVFLESSLEHLDDLVLYLNQNPSRRILLVGHVNGRAGGQYLKKAAASNPEKKRYDNAWHLSISRAQSVKDYLQASGISEDRMDVEGKGGKERQYKKASNALEDEANRRLEVFVIL